MAESRAGRNVVVLLEGLVLIVSGGLTALFALSSLAIAVRGPALDNRLAALFGIPFALFFFSFARKSYRSLREILDGIADPADFFSVEWNSGLSFLVIAFVVIIFSTIALRERAKLMEKASGKRPRWQDVLR